MNLNRYVFTTKKIIKKEQAVLRVLYDIDGDFQFLNVENNLEVEDSALVSLGEMFSLDKTLEDIIPSLSVGEMAYREQVNSPWIIKKISEENIEFYLNH